MYCNLEHKICTVTKFKIAYLIIIETSFALNHVANSSTLLNWYGSTIVIKEIYLIISIVRLNIRFHIKLMAFKKG